MIVLSEKSSLPHPLFLGTYLYFVTRQWRNTAICTLVKSVPTQNLMPPPKAMKCLEPPFNSDF